MTLKGDLPSDIAFSVYIDDLALLDNSQWERVPVYLNVLRRKFGSSIVLSCSGVRSNHISAFSAWLGDGLIERVVCSSSAKYVFDDAVNAALSVEARVIIFVDMECLFSDFPAVLKFSVSTLRSSEKASLDQSGRMASVDIDVLKLSRRDHFQDDFVKTFEVIRRCGGTIDREGSKRERGYLSMNQLFVTDAGLRRLGGKRPFASASVTFGGVPSSEYPRVMIIYSQGGERETFVHHFPESEIESVPAYIATEGESIVYDIVPAATSPTQSHLALNLPRLTLVGRRVPLHVDVKDDFRAVFVCSNYNKSRYIGAMLYGAMTQLHPRVAVEVVDDGSLDGSLNVVEAFKRTFDLSDDLVSVRRNQCNLGTYWIRNDIIFGNKADECVFFVNDSDDYSTSLRVVLQLSMLGKSDGYGNFLDIVRVSKDYVTAPLNGEVERYGTASLCFTRKLINRIGYFQVVKKNADTEFIERARRFVGKEALPWVRYVGLIQPFDGDNLTNDMYEQVGDNSFSARKSDARAAYTDIFRRYHERISGDEVALYYQFPRATMPDEISVLGSEFLVQGYESTDRYLIFSGKRPDELTLRRWVERGMNVLYVGDDEAFEFVANRGSRIVLHMSLLCALDVCARVIGDRFYIIPSAVLTGADRKMTIDQCEHLFNNLVWRSKSRGDSRAICQDGSTIAVSEALARGLHGSVSSDSCKASLIPYSRSRDGCFDKLNEHILRMGSLVV